MLKSLTENETRWQGITPKRIEKCLGYYSFLLQLLLQFSDKFKWQYLNGGKIKAKNLTSKFNCLVAEVVSVTWILTSVCKGLIVKVVVLLATLKRIKRSINEFKRWEHHTSTWLKIRQILCISFEMINSYSVQPSLNWNFCESVLVQLTKQSHWILIYKLCSFTFAEDKLHWYNCTLEDNVRRQEVVVNAGAISHLLELSPEILVDVWFSSWWLTKRSEKGK